MLTLVLLSFVMSAQANEPVWTPAQTLAEKYEQAKQPSLDAIMGWYEGRCYGSTADENQADFSPFAPRVSALFVDSATVDGVSVTKLAVDFIFSKDYYGTQFSYPSNGEYTTHSAAAEARDMLANKQNTSVVALDGALSSTDYAANRRTFVRQGEDGSLYARVVRGVLSATPMYCYFYKTIVKPEPPKPTPVPVPVPSPDRRGS